MSAAVRTIGVIALTALVTSAQTCITFNDEGVISVNVESFTDTFPVSVGATSFANPTPDRCETKSPADYVDASFETIQGARLVDATIQTLGSFSANIVGGRVTVQNVTQNPNSAEVDLISYSGPWNSFNTEQSLLSSPLVTRNAGGITLLTSALNKRHAVRFCEYGTFSVPATGGLSVVTKFYAQMDVKP